MTAQAAGSRPRLQALLICRGGSSDETSGEVSLRGIIKAISIPPPEPNTVSWGEVYIYLSIDDARAGTRVTLTVFSPADTFNLQIMNDTPPRHADATMPMEFVVETRIPMMSPGRYELRCLIDGEPAGHTTFVVHHAPDQL